MAVRSRMSARQMLCVAAAVGVLLAAGLVAAVVYRPMMDWGKELWTSFDRGDRQGLPDGAIEYRFVDVGQGDCTLILTPWGNVLVDAGSNATECSLRDYLKEQGIGAFDLVVFTHPDEDHIGAADMILADFEVSRVLLPDVPDDSSAALRMYEGIEASGAECLTAHADMTLWVGEVRLDVLAPVRADYSASNDHSVVIKVTYGQTTALLTGDAGVAAEADMLVRYGADVLHSDVLKVAHHGAATSSSEEFLRAVAPQYAVISAGWGNTYDHPNAAVMTRLTEMGVRIGRTDTMGNVLLATDGVRWYTRD